jgi:hypothetical protein
VAFVGILFMGAQKRKLFQIEKSKITAILMKQVSASFYPVEIHELDTISPILIYRYPEFSCDVCYRDDLELLKAFKNETGTDRICILPAFDDSRENRILLSNELKGFNFINFASTDTIPLFKSGGAIQRYFALYEKNAGFRMIFFPDRQMPDLTSYYLQEIVKISGFQ